MLCSKFSSPRFDHEDFVALMHIHNFEIDKEREEELLGELRRTETPLLAERFEHYYSCPICQNSVQHYLEKLSTEQRGNFNITAAGYCCELQLKPKLF